MQKFIKCTYRNMTNQKQNTTIPNKASHDRQLTPDLSADLIILVMVFFTTVRVPSKLSSKDARRPFPSFTSVPILDVISFNIDKRELRAPKCSSC